MVGIFAAYLWAVLNVPYNRDISGDQKPGLSGHPSSPHYWMILYQLLKEHAIVTVCYLPR